MYIHICVYIHIYMFIYMFTYAYIHPYISDSEKIWRKSLPGLDRHSTSCRMGLATNHTQNQKHDKLNNNGWNFWKKKSSYKNISCLTWAWSNLVIVSFIFQHLVLELLAKTVKEIYLYSLHCILSRAIIKNDKIK